MARAPRRAQPMRSACHVFVGRVVCFSSKCLELRCYIATQLDGGRDSSAEPLDW